MGYKNMKSNKQIQQQKNKLYNHNKELLEQIEFLLTKGTSEFLANARAKIEKNKQELQSLKQIEDERNRKREESKSIKRLNSIGSSSGMFVSKRREHQYQEPIDRVAYRVSDKESYLKFKASKKIN
jgi:hypothetical protein